VGKLLEPGVRAHVPSILQMEAVECGAASLAMVLAYYGKWVTLEELRRACGVSRDGSNAANLLRAARSYGLECKGYRKEPSELKELRFPVIGFWNFNHFLVIEGFDGGLAHLADPATGPRAVTAQEFDESFTGVVLTFEPGPDFKPGGSKPSLRPAIEKRLLPSKEALTYVVIAGLALVVPGLVIPTFSRIFVDDYLVHGMTDWIRPLLLGMLATAAMRGGLTWLQKHYLNRLETKLSVAGSGKFLWHVLRLPVDFYTQRFSGDIAARVAINKRLAHVMASDMANAAVDLVMVVFYAILMLTISVPLTLIGLAALAANVQAARAIQRKRIDGSRRLVREQGKLMGVSMGGLQAIETLKASGAESDFFATWAGHQAKLVSYEQQLQEVTLPFMQAPVLIQSLTTAAILIAGGLLVMDGQLTLGLLTAFQSLMASFIEPVNRGVALMGTLQEVEGDVTRLDDVMAYPVDPATEGERADAPPPTDGSAPAKLSGLVELKGVTFGYSRLADPLITDFSLKLKPGSRVALVGPSGCGKSTVSKVVTGLYAPWEGEILFDGIRRQDLPRAVLANSVALVDQDISLFEGSVRDNLTLWDSTVTEEQLVRACKDACIHNDIVSRPGGYDSLLEEGGVNLSGGQRQRLEIARALVLEPRVLVLDEATSALDTVTEKLIDENLRRRGCTCIIIAHRLSTVRDADEIIVLELGKVVQRGTHDKLKSEEGRYATLTAE
jgi:NHLM bacteriocin system ABC transporter peptidase/ATP-binding protein